MTMLRIKSYEGSRPGLMNINDSMLDAQSVKGRRVLIVDDIMETGRTLRAAKDYVEQQFRPADVKTCVLLAKPNRDEGLITPDYVGIPNVPDVFVVGYGLDHQDRYRRLRYITTVQVKELPPG